MRNKHEYQISDTAKRTINPIRGIVDKMRDSNPNKRVISLALGDPTTTIHTHPSVTEAVIQEFKSNSSDGYRSAIGSLDARKAVGKRYNVDPENIVLTNGCSGALDIAMNVVCGSEDTILIPKPGFSLYKTVCLARNLKFKYYNLLPDLNWQADLDHLQSLVDSSTKCILINNPSNPCGAVYSEEHLRALLEFAETNNLVVIADEIYGDMVFKDHKFHSLGNLTTNVPVFVCGGLAKEYLVPGWRLGWIMVYDKQNVMPDATLGLFNLASVVLGPTVPIQNALGKILSTPQSFFDETREFLESNYNLMSSKISSIQGLKPISAQGTLYIMVEILFDHFDGIADDLDFTQRLFREESVMCLPGTIFGRPNFFRIVFSINSNDLVEAFDRLSEFCSRHRKK